MNKITNQAKEFVLATTNRKRLFPAVSRLGENISGMK